MSTIYKYPKLHNATWPGIVGKGEGSEPIIPLEDMIRFTANSEVDGVKFDGVDVGLLKPHVDINKGKEEARRLADLVLEHKLKIGTLVAPIWEGTTIGSQDKKDVFIDMVRKSCEFGQYLKEFGVREYGVIRVDSSCSVEDWAKSPKENTAQIVQVFQQASDVAKEYGESLAAEGEICWGAMHSWRAMLETLEAVNRDNFGFQADMAHTLLYLLGYNSPQDRVLPENFDWSDKTTLKEGLKKISSALGPYTIDFHVAQNDGSVFGSGSHDKTGRHCLPNDPNGRLEIAKDAGFWLRDEKGELTKAVKHICWDGCMFPNEKLKMQSTWNDILKSMVAVKNAHGWN